MVLDYRDQYIPDQVAFSGPKSQMACFVKILHARLYAADGPESLFKLILTERRFTQNYAVASIEHSYLKSF